MDRNLPASCTVSIAPRTRLTNNRAVGADSVHGECHEKPDSADFFCSRCAGELGAIARRCGDAWHRDLCQSELECVDIGRVRRRRCKHRTSTTPRRNRRLDAAGDRSRVGGSRTRDLCVDARRFGRGHRSRQTAAPRLSGREFRFWSTELRGRCQPFSSLRISRAAPDH